MARTYKRDNRGRFASGGTSSSGAKAKAAKSPTRGRNRITRDNAGRITSVGGQGATARGGRLKTAAGNKRGAVVAKMSLRRGGVAGKPKGLKPGTLKGKVAGGGKAQSASAIRNKARLDGDAFAARMKRAQGATLKRGLNESDRENSLTGAQRWSPAKRFEASNRRWAKTERTMAAAKQFYRNYGSPATFGLRQKQTTASSPSFGSKRRRSRRR